MSQWLQLGLMDAYSPVMEEFLYFHDFTNMILLFILLFVGVMMTSMATNTFLYKGLLEGQMLECVWTMIPAIILIQIALPSLSLLYLMEDSPSPDMSVKVVGHQWFWSYEYSDFWVNNNVLGFDSYMIPEQDLEPGMLRQLETDNRVVVPFMTKMRMLISSSDVLHSWTIPSLGVKADAIPGRINQINFIGLMPGVLYGQCSEICGSQHSSMPIALELISLKDFNMWLNWMEN
uniref:Cytochrome c oxidase subunit 2 n=1 Tax=Paracyclopina nana TaxID=565004 RepID=C0J6S1_PARNA|nr:cytochrome c oxidase subunit II [Paracyclopina nana]